MGYQGREARVALVGLDAVQELAAHRDQRCVRAVRGKGVRFMACPSPPRRTARSWSSSLRPAMQYGGVRLMAQVERGVRLMALVERGVELMAQMERMVRSLAQVERGVSLMAQG